MTPQGSAPGRLPGTFASQSPSSFTEFLSVHSPNMLPANREVPPGVPAGEHFPHGTTIVTVTFPQLSLAVGASKSQLLPHSTLLLGTQVMLGTVVSTTVTV